MTQFYTNDAISLEKTLNIRSKPTNSAQLYFMYEIPRCLEWIETNKFSRICLQFPDHLLCDSGQIAQKIQEKLDVGKSIFILADTAYDSCCIDYVAAAHANSDAIIHYGPVCFSQTSGKIPFLNIYGKTELDLFKFQVELDNIKIETLIIILDTPFYHLERQFQEKNPEIDVKTDYGNLHLEGINSVIYICDNSRKIQNFYLDYKPKKLYYFNQNTNSITQFTENAILLKRRNFLIEKIKDSHTIGIVIGTLSVKNYLKQIDRLKNLIELNKKKFYLISVGKPTVAKLANFAEIDIYVIVTCAQNDIFESREFYQPIVTPYDMEMALNHSLKGIIPFSLDFNNYVSNEINVNEVNESDVSLITGRIRGNEEEEESREIDGNEVVLRDKGVLAVNYNHFGAGFLAQRSWQGLEQNLEKSDVEMASEGRRGIAQHYEEEK